MTATDFRHVTDQSLIGLASAHTDSRGRTSATSDVDHALRKVQGHAQRWTPGHQAGRRIASSAETARSAIDAYATPVGDMTPHPSPNAPSRQTARTAVLGLRK